MQILFSSSIRFLVFTLLLMLGSCVQSGKTENLQAEKRQYVQQQNPVEVIVLKEGPFKQELVNNGKLAALRKSELKFRVNEQLERINVKNGERIDAGQLIASLVPFTYQQRLKSADISLKQASLELRNVLIGQGYNDVDSTQIPGSMYQMALIRSGYSEALENLESARFDLKSTELRAPFSGIIASITQKQFEQVNTGDAFCTLIDDSEFEVEFDVVENEVGIIGLGDEVQVVPFSQPDKICKGKISEINPMIDDNGMISIKARLKNPGDLMEGMNVKVLVEKDIPRQLIVPKSAVVLRQNQEVLFKYTHGTAFWTYVQTVAENSSSYSVLAHPEKGGTLAPGDTIIVSGNLNLAHESEVVIE